MHTDETEKINQSKNFFRGEILNLLKDQNSRLGNLAEWSNEGLLVMDQALAFWCADGIIRLLGVEESPKINWKKIYEEALNFASQLNLESLAKLYLQTGDATTIRALIICHLDRAATLAEFNKRFGSFRTENKIINFLYGENKHIESPVLKQIDYDIKGLYKLKMIPKETASEIIDLGKSLRPPLRIFQKEKGIDKREDSEKDDRQETILKVLEYYQRARRSIKVKEWNNIRSDLIGEFRKIEGSGWEKVAPGLLRQLIKKGLEIYLPALEGNLKNIPYQVYREKMKTSRAEMDSKVERTWRKLEKKAREDEGDAHTRNLKSWGKKRRLDVENPIDLQEKGLHDYRNPEDKLLEIEQENNKNEKIEWIEKEISKLITKAKKPEAVREAFRLLREGKTEKQAAEMSGIDSRTIRNYLLILRKSTTRPKI